MKLFRYIVFFLLLIPFSVVPQNVGSDSNEYNLKALFIFNFIKYVDWPKTNENSNFKIVVLGESEIMEPLQKIADQRKLNNQKIEIQETEDVDEIDCRVLFIPRAMSDHLQECVNACSGKGVLIVTEGKNLASKGAAINFIMINNKMKFEINQIAMRNAGLRVSNQLLDLAIVVK